MIYGFQNSKRGFSTANPFFEAELHIWKEPLLFRKFFQTIEEDHLVDFAESREESNTPIVISIISFSTFTFEKW